MDGDRPPADAPDALGAQRAGGADRRREAELSPTRWVGLEVLGGLPGRAGRTRGLEVKHESGLREAALIRGVRHFRDERSAGVGERLTGLTAAVGAVSHRRIDRAANVRLGLLDQLQRTLGIRRV